MPTAGSSAVPRGAVKLPGRKSRYYLLLHDNAVPACLSERNAASEGGLQDRHQQG